VCAHSDVYPLCRVDSFRQTESYPVYAFAHGLIDGQARAWLQDEWDACLERLEGRLVGSRVEVLVGCVVLRPCYVARVCRA
jgi:hypothetical protein